MPANFADIQGLAGAQLIAARGEHEVELTGPTRELVVMVPSIRVAPALGQLAAPGVLAQIELVTLPSLAWLMLAALYPGDDIPAGQLLIEGLVLPQRFGAAFDRCVLAGMDTTACTASVARERLRAMAAQTRGTDPVPFTVVHADLYMLRAFEEALDA